MKPFNHTRPRRNADGAIISQQPAPVARVTVAELGGQFGSDKRRRLVVTLSAGDVIEFRPARTRQTVTMLAVDLYRVALRAMAGRAQLEKARAKKESKARQRSARRIACVDKKLTKEAKENTL